MAKENMVVHPLIKEDRAKDVLVLAETLGLDKIKYNELYNVYKVGSKKYPDEVLKELAIRRASLVLIGSSDGVSLFCAGSTSWFKTSAVVDCYKTTKVYKIETLNSIYELEMCK